MKKRFIIFFMSLIMAGGLLRAETQEANAAMVISGGVSLGAYEAGYNWAIIRLLRILGDKSPYIRPKLRSIAGASAGSINALLSTVYWCQREDKNAYNSVDNNLFYDTWTGIDIEDLAIEGYDPENNSTLFTRKPLVEKANLILQHMNRPIFRKGCRVPLGIMVTKVKPIEESFQGITIKNQSFAIPLTVYEKNSHLFIENRKIPDSDKHFLNTLEIPGIDRDNSKIKDILFASSAFPGAFTQVKLHYKYKGKEGSGYFLDGGVYNNIPLDMALALAPSVNNFLFIDPDTIRDFPYKECINPKVRSFLNCKGPCKKLISRKRDNNSSQDDDIDAGFIGTNLLPLFKSTQIFRSMKLYETINRYFRFHPERHLILSSRYHPITGNFMWAFGAFLDKNFREYDYYVGVYDAIYRLAQEARKRGFGKGKTLPEQMNRYKKMLKISNSRDAKIVYDMLLKAEFCNKKPLKSANRFAAIYDAFNLQLPEKKRYTLKEFSNFIKRLDTSHIKLEDDSFLAYAKAHPDDWYQRTARTFVDRVALLENQRAQEDPDYAPVARAVDFSAWLSMGYLAKREGIQVQPLFIPSLKNSWANIGYRLLPSEFAIDAVNGGFSLGYSIYWYGKAGPFDGAQLKLSYNHGKHISDHLRMDLDPFIRFRKTFSFGAGISVFGNLQHGPFWERENAFGANIFIDYNDIFRLTYVRRFGRPESRDHVYFGIKNLPSLFYWLNR